MKLRDECGPSGFEGCLNDTAVCGGCQVTLWSSVRSGSAMSLMGICTGS